MNPLIPSLVLLLSLATASPKPDLTSLAGYHVIWSYSGPTIPQDLLAATKAGKVGGIIFFGENVSDNLPAQIESLQNAYKTSRSYAGFPLLIVTDQEGGFVNRLTGGPTQSAKQIGNSTHPAEAAATAADTVADVFGKYNTNGDLAPVLDVYRESGDFIDRYQRSYGNTSQRVAQCIGPFISTLQSNGYVATAKHFPGLGAAPRDANTDVSPVTLNLSLEKLRKVDERPYVSAIWEKVAMVMASWAIYPALDSVYPSGLSRKWIQGELRGRFGFRGVTITDALEAGSLAAFGDTRQRTLLAMAAGMDIVLASARNTTQGAEAVDAIVDGLKSGKINRRKFEMSTKRIVEMRRRLGRGK